MCTHCGCTGTATHIEALHEHRAHDHREEDQRVIEVETRLLSKNDRYAEQNRQIFIRNKVSCLNFMSSPGAGKTELLVRTIEALKDRYQIAVIEGDQQTDHDARRIHSTGVDAVQINTGKGCHLDAHNVGHCLEHFDLPSLDFLFIENVGNLVCPAAFDLGEAAKVVILSVTEGEDKPLKYPDMFQAATLMLINKVDLLPYLEFELDKTIAYARQINPDIEVLLVSAKTEQGFKSWCDWLQRQLEAKIPHNAAEATTS